MRVVHVIESMRIDRGGPITVVTELARAQALAGAKVVVAHRQDMSSDVDRTAAESRWSGLNIVSHDASRKSLDKLLAGGRDSETVVHLHGIWDLEVLRACSAARRHGVPWVVSTHGMLHPAALARRRWKKELFLLLAGSLLRRASEVIVLNRTESEESKRRLGRSPVVMPNGVDPAVFAEGDGGLAFRQRCPTLGSRPYVLFLGRLHPIKGTDALVRSFACAREAGLDADLVLAGPDEGGLAEALQMARHLGIAELVHAPGRLAGQIRVSAYSGCTVFAHRPIYEGFGLSVVEALAAGKHVVTTTRCELSGEGAGEFLCFAPDSDRCFGEVLASAAARAPSTSDPGAKEWVRDRFSWQTLAEQTLSLYRTAWSPDRRR
jgi:glycosyltransferase involved in cell wall biosynthesis